MCMEITCKGLAILSIRWSVCLSARFNARTSQRIWTKLGMKLRPSECIFSSQICISNCEAAQQKYTWNKSKKIKLFLKMSSLPLQHFGRNCFGYNVFTNLFMGWRTVRARQPGEGSPLRVGTAPMQSWSHNSGICALAVATRAYSRNKDKHAGMKG
jgi:hypothetical protein